MRNCLHHHAHAGCSRALPSPDRNRRGSGHDSCPLQEHAQQACSTHPCTTHPCTNPSRHCSKVNGRGCPIRAAQGYLLLRPAPPTGYYFSRLQTRIYSPFRPLLPICPSISRACCRVCSKHNIDHRTFCRCSRSGVLLERKQSLLAASSPLYSNAPRLRAYSASSRRDHSAGLFAPRHMRYDTHAKQLRKEPPRKTD